LIGRSRECDIVLADSNVSRRHAEIRPLGAVEWGITDLGSTNGVRVNGTQIRGTQRIASGDRLGIATVEADFEVE
jgi:pSer/pThr/pTyr-binding forkhead associated (FHA) protein